jgi:beta-lactamase regulating signal transducer with metallopeptidase domain
MMATFFLSAIRSVFLAGITSLLLAVLRVRHPLAKKVAWTAVLATAFVMPFIHGFTIPLSQTSPSISNFASSHAVMGPSHVEDRDLLSVPKPYFSNSFDTINPPIRLFWLVAYAMVSSLLLLRIVLGLLKALCLWRESSPTQIETTTAVRVSKEVRSPLTFGSGIVLPNEAHSWTPQTISVVLAHEREHVRQRDFYIQLLIRVYSSLFWISPLGWWLQREYAVLCEETSDYAALRVAPSTTVYAELLVKFCNETAPLTGIEMARVRGLRSRLATILTGGGFMNRFSTPLRAGILTALIIPCSLAIATLSIRAQGDGVPGQSNHTGRLGAQRGTAPKGFACIIDHTVPVVGVAGESGVEVGVASFTPKRLEVMKETLGNEFIAFHQRGRDYIITDPVLVSRAFDFFQPEQELTVNLVNSTTANTTSDTTERTPQEHFFDMRNLAIEQSEGAQRKAITSQLIVRRREAERNLQLLIERAQHAGKVTVFPVQDALAL